MSQLIPLCNGQPPTVARNQSCYTPDLIFPLSATEQYEDFGRLNINGGNYQPRGVIIDNTLGTGPAYVRITGCGLNIKFIAPTGKLVAIPYPGPTDQQAYMAGLGTVLFYFVDYDLEPFVL